MERILSSSVHEVIGTTLEEIFIFKCCFQMKQHAHQHLVIYPVTQAKYLLIKGC